MRSTGTKERLGKVKLNNSEKNLENYAQKVLISLVIGVIFWFMVTMGALFYAVVTQ